MNRLTSPTADEDQDEIEHQDPSRIGHAQTRTNRQSGAWSGRSGSVARISRDHRCSGPMAQLRRSISSVCPGPSQYRALESAWACGIVVQGLENEPSSSDIEKLSRELRSRAGLAGSLCRWAIETWA